MTDLTIGGLRMMVDKGHRKLASAYALIQIAQELNEIKHILNSSAPDSRALNIDQRNAAANVCNAMNVLDGTGTRVPMVLAQAIDALREKL
jgi:hypothetical protein